MAHPIVLRPQSPSAGLRRIIWFLLVFASPALSVDGSDATGFIRFANCNVSNQYRLTLLRYRKQKLKKAIVLEIPSEWGLAELTKDWLEVDGKQCLGDGPCEVVASKIRDVHFQGGHAVSGSFAVVVEDGRKLQGTFQAKYIKPLTRIICE